MNNYFLEIGVEEFPSRAMASTKEQLVRWFQKGAEEAGLSVGAIRCESTPRRFALWAEQVQALEQAQEEVVRGPSRRIAYDAQGQPTRALQGFLRSKGVTEADLYTEVQGKETYLFARVKKDAVSVPKALQAVVPQAIRRISNPRSMRWGGKNLQFLRPIRWLVSLLDDEVLPFDLEGIPVGRCTRGHRVLGSQSISVAHIAEYESKLEENYVIVSEAKRRDLIVRGLNRLASEKGGKPLMDEDLLDEVVSIVEYPTVFMGRIREEYLQLPPEVIITPMKDQQRYFPVVNDRGQLLPLFLSVRNGDAHGLDHVIRGNEKVLRPRLEDARFFYEQDLEQPLESYTEKLKGLVFHEKLGNMAEKQERLATLVRLLGESLSVGEETVQNAVRAAHLSKADLVTHMVVEFTELEGTMGRIYAAAGGENAIVSKAIEEQYMPRSSGAALASSTAGILLSLADKIDTLAGLHAIGIEVTGSQDPFGLRRAAIGVIDTIGKNRLELDLENCFRDAFLIYVEQFSLVFDYEQTMEKIRTFFLGRLKNKLREENYRYDVIDAVLATGAFDLCAWVEKVKVISEVLQEHGEDLITSFVRVDSLAEKATTHLVSAEVLQEEDQALYASLDREKAITEAIKARHYREALCQLAEWMPLVNSYLDQTMILVEDEALRTARLAMLSQIDHTIRQLLVPKLIVRA